MMRSMNLRDKILSREALVSWRAAQRTSGRRLVVTNGCFDILHAGHVTYLEAARNQGDALLVGLNSDASVRDIKGSGRPVNTEEDRAVVLAALESVTAVCIFGERDALQFLRVTEPDVYVKGGDYNLETINQPERRLVESMGGKVVVLGGMPGKSTTGTLERIRGLPRENSAGA